MEKRVFLSKSFFQGSTTKSSRFRRNISMKKDLSFEKVFFFCCHFWSLSDSFVLLQSCLVRCVKPPIIVQREINGKYNLENLFSLNNFGLWAEKTWTLSKTVRSDSQNCSLHMQMKIFRFFSGSKNICLKVLGHWMEASNFRWKCFLRVVEGTVHVSSATFFGLWDEKNGSFSQKVLFRVQPTRVRASREAFQWKKISLSKKFSFFVIIFGVSVTSLSFCKIV